MFLCVPRDVDLVQRALVLHVDKVQAVLVLGLFDPWSISHSKCTQKMHTCH